MTAPINIKISTQHQKERQRIKQLERIQNWNGRTIKMKDEDSEQKHILDLIKDKRNFK